MCAPHWRERKVMWLRANPIGCLIAFAPVLAKRNGTNGNEGLIRGSLSRYVDSHTWRHRELAPLASLAKCPYVIALAKSIEQGLALGFRWRRISFKELRSRKYSLYSFIRLSYWSWLGQCVVVWSVHCWQGMIMTVRLVMR